MLHGFRAESHGNNPCRSTAPSNRQGSFDSVNPFASEWVVCAQDDIASCLVTC